MATGLRKIIKALIAVIVLIAIIILLFLVNAEERKLLIMAIVTIEIGSIASAMLESGGMLSTNQQKSKWLIKGAVIVRVLVVIVSTALIIMMQLSISNRKDNGDFSKTSGYLSNHSAVVLNTTMSE